jgi:hypothetical protein
MIFPNSFNQYNDPWKCQAFLIRWDTSCKHFARILQKRKGIFNIFFNYIG